MYVVATATVRDPATLKQRAPAVWRRVRRFNAPAQLSIAAAERVLEYASDRTDTTLISLAPCQAGSPDALGWVDRVNARKGDDGPLRINPVHTLHAVDNLALSALSIEIGSTADGIGLGGAAGQVWEALDIARHRLQASPGREVVIVAGDQDDARTAAAPVAAAMLLSARRGFASIDAVERIASEGGAVPHAARGLVALIEALDRGPGPLRHEVDAADGDGFDQVIVLGAVLEAAP